MNSVRILTVSFALIALLGCSRASAPSNTAPTPQQAKAAQQEQTSDRTLLDQIPPPAKSRYLAIHSRDGWQNPFLVVSQKTVSLRIMYPAPPQSNALPGSMLQPANARKRVLQLRLADLPEALASLPEDSWPYGRVVALEEDPNESRTNRIQVRRNVESTMQMLNDLGVVVYEWPGLH